VIEQAYRAAYNLDHDVALALARKAVALAPEESAAHRGLAGILWLRIVYLRGAVTIDHYISGIMDGRLGLPPADATLDAEFKSALGRAMALAEARLARDGRDLAARYDAGRAHALQASYTASVEASAMRAMRSAKRAFDAEERVLDADPRHPGATFIVGTYRYIISTLPMHLRALAYLVGFGGGKDRGIAMVQEAATHPLTSVDAKTALMLIFTREGRHAEVMQLARELAAAFPGNRFYALEEGAAALRAGRLADAERLLTRGLAIVEADPRPTLPGERGAWLYKRGIARLAMRRLPDAAADLVAALEAGPPGWIRGRIHVELGKLHDIAGHRDRALADYRMGKSICETNNDPACISAANRGIRRAEAR
jgi:tetratricopeptide (TPR) repeat protein